MAGKNYYSILGINKKSSEREIKQAYRRLARQYHPDVNPGDRSAEAKFKQINEAYEVLSDKKNRKKYDRFGDKWQHADQFAQAQQSPSWNFSQAGGAQGLHFEEADLEGLFGNLFGGTFRRQRVSPRRGHDIEYPVEVTLEEAYHGTKRNISLQGEEPCPTCQGTGRIQSALCSACRGAGVISRVKRLEVKIPAGVKTGSRVRIAGKGQPGYAGGASGDLYLITAVKPHKSFERKDNKLYVEVEVPLTVAMLGGEIQVPSLKGKLALKIPPETQNGRTFRLTGQGMPHPGDSSRGDLLARVKVILPTKLSSKEKELFKQLSGLRPV